MSSTHPNVPMDDLQISPRRTRSRPKPAEQKRPNDQPPKSSERQKKTLPSNAQNARTMIKPLPTILTPRTTNLSQKDHNLLIHKEKWLRSHTISIPKGSKNLQPAVEATLVFAQQEAGTAVCISATGLILTCSHCIAESAAEFDGEKSHWLLFASGRVAETKCVAWDAKRDLALLEIVAAQQEEEEEDAVSGLRRQEFPSISPADSASGVGTALGCIGHPGSEDLETSLPGVKTNYDVLHVSIGKFRGNVDGQDLQDNSEIGALEHDCWTYWGHSGAPLVNQGTEIVGLHSSWDEETGMRRGVPLEAIRQFLEHYAAV